MVDCGNHGSQENDENHGNPGCKPRVPQTTDLEISDHNVGWIFRGWFSSADLRRRDASGMPSPHMGMFACSGHRDHHSLLCHLSLEHHLDVLDLHCLLVQLAFVLTNLA